jgi:hypothetical protein
LKKSSHEASEGTITRRLPSRNTVTDLTLSGKATSFDSLTACDLLEWNSVVLLTATSGIYPMYIRDGEKASGSEACNLQYVLLESSYDVDYSVFYGGYALYSELRRIQASDQFSRRTASSIVILRE